MAATDLQGPFARIISKTGFSYQLTSEDILWTARMAQFEGGTSVPSTLWTVTQRFIYTQNALKKALGHPPTFTEFLRAFSQPINPRWESMDAPKCKQYPERCTEAQLRRRLRARTIQWEELNSTIRATVLKWSGARLSNPVPRSVDFADARVSQYFLDHNPGSIVVKKAGNWHIATAQSRKWDANQVVMAQGENVARADGPILPWMLATAVGVVAAGLLFMKGGF